MRFHKFGKKLLHRVERTEGMKFKKKPTLHTTSRVKHGGFNYFKGRIDKDKVTSVIKAKVALSPRLFSPRRRLEGSQVLLHELRENLYYQNQGKMTKGKAHRKARRWGHKDVLWLKRQGVKNY